MVGTFNHTLPRKSICRKLDGLGMTGAMQTKQSIPQLLEDKGVMIRRANMITQGVPQILNCVWVCELRCVCVSEYKNIDERKLESGNYFLNLIYHFSSTSRSHRMCAATLSASSLRVRLRLLSAGGWTWFCSFTEGLEACSRNWMTSCTGDGSVLAETQKVGQHLLAI